MQYRKEQLLIGGSDLFLLLVHNLKYSGKTEMFSDICRSIFLFLYYVSQKD